MRAASRDVRMSMLGLGASLAALGCALVGIRFLREIHDFLGPEVEYLMGNEDYPCRALPPASGVMPWFFYGLIVLLPVAVAVVFAAVAWRGFASMGVRSPDQFVPSGAAVFAGVLICIAIVTVVLAIDYTYQWTQYANAGPNGQTSKCPPTNGEWHQGQVILLAVAGAATALALYLLRRGRRDRAEISAASAEA